MADLGQGGSGGGGGGGDATEATLLTRATEATLAALNAKIGALGQQLSAASSSVVISTEQEAIFDAIKTAVEAIDVDTNGIAKDATLLATNGLLTTIDAVLDSIKVDTASIAGEDFATQTTLAALLVELQLKADLTETQPVSAATLPLPTGAATSANQLPNGHDVTVDNAGGAAAVNIQDGGNSITVDATALPLPTGASTSALQTALNALITTIDAVLDSIKVDTGLLIPVATALTSLAATVNGTVTAGQKAVAFFIDGPNGAINGVARPNGWSQTFEFNNDTTPAIPYTVGSGTTIYIDYLA